MNIKEKVRVQVELRKGKSIEGERSEPVDFYYLPLERNHQNLQGRLKRGLSRSYRKEDMKFLVFIIRDVVKKKVAGETI